MPLQLRHRQNMAAFIESAMDLPRTHEQSGLVVVAPAVLRCGKIEEIAGPSCIGTSEMPALSSFGASRRWQILIPTLFVERQFAHAFSRGCEYGVAQGCNVGRHSRLADSRGRGIALDQMHIGLHGRFRIRVTG